MILIKVESLVPAPFIASCNLSAKYSGRFLALITAIVTHVNSYAKHFGIIMWTRDSEQPSILCTLISTFVVVCFPNLSLLLALVTEKFPRNLCIMKI